MENKTGLKGKKKNIYNNNTIYLKIIIGYQTRSRKKIKDIKRTRIWTKGEKTIMKCAINFHSVKITEYIYEYLNSEIWQTM